MDDFELPEDLAEDVEVIYLDNEEDIEYGEEEMDDMPPEEPAEDVVDQAKVTFRGHKEPVFACALSKDNKVAVTGGQDDMAYVWSIETGELLYECTGHKDSVTHVEFNHDGKLVVTADMGGLVQVWSVQDKNLIWCNEGDDITFLFWHPKDNILINGTSPGEVYIWQVPQSNCKVFPSNGQPVTCAKVLNDGKRIIVGYENGQLKLWDIKTTSIVWHTTVQEEIINSLEINEQNNIVVVAPSGDCFKLSDGRLINNFKQADGGEIEAIAFNTELNAVITGTTSGNLYIWDLSRAVLRHHINLEKYIIAFEWGKDCQLIVGNNDGKLHICDIRTGTLIQVLTGHTQEILSMKVASDHTFVLSTSEDHTAKIFELKN